MKSSDKPELSKKWWAKEKPAEIKGADLEKALASCESALAEVKKKENEDTIAAALEALEALDDAVEDTIKECEKKKLKDVATVLGKFDKLISEKTKELEKCQAAQAKDAEDEDKEDEEEEGKTVFKPEYLARMIKMLRGGEQLQFAMGLNKQTPADSCLVLCNKRKSERLFKMLKQKGEFAARLLTFGTAAGDGKILNLTLSDNAKEPSQIIKTAKEFFKGHRDLKYRKIRVHAGGETFEEDMPEDESQPVASGENTNTGDLQARTRKAEAADQAWQKARVSISDQIAQVQRELNAFQDPDAIAVHDGLISLVDTLPDPALSALAGSQDAGTYTSNLEKTRLRLQELQKLIAQGGPLQTVDSNPFFKTDIVGTVNSVLSSITKELQIA